MVMVAAYLSAEEVATLTRTAICRGGKIAIRIASIAGRDRQHALVAPSAADESFHLMCKQDIARRRYKSSFSGAGKRENPVPYEL